ncbi:MAG: serine protease [Bdellovibrionota bacterium]
MGYIKQNGEGSLFSVLSLVILALSFSFFTTPVKADEGFHILSQRDLAQVSQKLQKLYRLNQKETIQLDRFLPQLIQSTFQISCKNLRGTGFFIGPTGEFITAAHVLSSSAPCKISLNELTQTVAGMVYLPRSYEVSFEIAATRHYGGTDISLGQIRLFKSPDYLAVESGPLSQGERLIALGYPKPTRRKAFSAKDRRRLDTHYLAACNLKRNLFGRVKILNVKLPEASRPGIPCMMGALNRPYKGRSPKNYDDVTRLPSGEESLVATVGNLSMVYGEVLYTDLDIIAGFSGGPMFSLERGSVVGVTTAVLDARPPKGVPDLQSVLYAGASFGARVRCLSPFQCTLPE